MQQIKHVRVVLSMKKHLLGILISLMAFSFGFLASPVRFISFAVGQTSRGWFTAYESTRFVKLTLEGENYETSEEAKEAFESRIKQYYKISKKQEALELDENRTIVMFQTKHFEQGVCIVRKEKFSLYSICSSSLQHALEFEKQRFN